MNDKVITELARAMQKAYATNTNRENAVIEVAYQYPNASVNTLRAMWSAIDAYVYMRGAEDAA